MEQFLFNQRKMLLPLALVFTFVLISSITMAQVTGTVFRDFNGNGTKDNTAAFNEVGMPNVVIKAIDASGASTTTTTDINGNYSFSGATPGSVRL